MSVWQILATGISFGIAMLAMLMGMNLLLNNSLKINIGVNKKQKKIIYKDLLSYLYTDLLMLKDGSWDPDEESIDASINTLNIISELLKIKPKDLRNNEKH